MTRKTSSTLKTIGTISLAALMLTGCAIFGGRADKALRRSANFRAGYSDGCAAATAQTANPRDDKDTLAGEDKLYKRGYSMGFQSCQQRPIAPSGAPTGGFSHP